MTTTVSNVPISYTVEYQVWSAMKYRCISKKSPGWKRYGGRGIKVCQRWLDDFNNFLEDMGPRPSDDHSLDRYPDNDGDYEPGNCRWATLEEQANNRSDNVHVDYNGESLTLTQVARLLGVQPQFFYRRYKKGMTFDEIAAIPDIERTFPRYTHDGQTKTLPQWAKDLNLNYLTLTQRMRSGLTFEEAITRPIRSFVRRFYTYGEQTKPIKDWAEASGIDLETLRFRLRSGWSFEEAITRPKQKRTYEK